MLDATIAAAAAAAAAAAEPVFPAACCHVLEEWKINSAKTCALRRQKSSPSDERFATKNCSRLLQKAVNFGDGKLAVGRIAKCEADEARIREERLLKCAFGCAKSATRVRRDAL